MSILAFFLLELPLGEAAFENLFAVHGRLVVIDPDFAGGSGCDSHDDVLDGAEGHVGIADVVVLISHEKGSCCGFGEIFGLFAVEAFEATHEEVIGANDF